MTTRRDFISGLVGLVVAAPAIVRASSLMPVKALPPDDVLELFRNRLAEAEAEAIKNIESSLYGELTDITRSVFVPRLTAQIYAKSPIMGILGDHYRHSVWAIRT